MSSVREVGGGKMLFFRFLMLPSMCGGPLDSLPLAHSLLTMDVKANMAFLSLAWGMGWGHGSTLSLNV